KPNVEAHCSKQERIIPQERIQFCSALDQAAYIARSALPGAVFWHGYLAWVDTLEVNGESIFRQPFVAAFAKTAGDCVGVGCADPKEGDQQAYEPSKLHGFISQRSHVMNWISTSGIARVSGLLIA